MHRFYATIIFLLLMNLSIQLKAQSSSGEIVDEIVASVADKIILHSELEFSYQQLKHEYGALSDTVKCSLLQQKLIEKLLLTKAQVDSITINEDRVDAELEERIRYFARQFGGEKALEDYYGRSIAEIKASNRDKIRDNQLVAEMQRKIIKDIKVTPSDIKAYYSHLSKDSLPLYSAELEIAKIVIAPKVSKEAKQVAYDKLSDLRKRILNGDKFKTLAMIYSDDKGSAMNGGELGFFNRGKMVPEFEAAAFRLLPDSLSKIVETQFGYHLLQGISRKGDDVNVRHILIMPKIYSSDVELARRKIDSIAQLIKMDSISFSDAARKFSDDEATKSNGGFLAEGGSKIAVDALPHDIYLKISSLKPGEMTEPELSQTEDPDPKKVWVMYYLKSETKPHRANIRDDYQKLQQLAQQQKQNDAMEKWIIKNKSRFYIYINDNYKNCTQLKNWLSK